MKGYRNLFQTINYFRTVAGMMSPSYSFDITLYHLRYFTYSYRGI